MPRVSKGSIDKHKEKAMVALRLPNIGVQELQKVKFKKNARFDFDFRLVTFVFKLGS